MDFVSSDEQCITDLRQRQQERESVKALLWSPQLASLHPSELPRSFLLVSPMTQQETSSGPHGQWKEEKRVAVMDRFRSYVGVKTILKFVPHAGKKRGHKDCWFMFQYNNLREEGPNLVIEEGKMTLCKVLNSPPAGEFFENFEKLLSSSDSEEELTPSKEGRLMEMCKDLEKVMNDAEVPKGDDVRPAGSSLVWNHFTKIFQKQINENALQLAACHECGEILKADPKRHGTSSLKRHRDGHLKKHTA